MENVGTVRLILNKYLDKNNITMYQLSKSAGVGYNIILNYYHNRAKRYDSSVLARICGALGCNISDILEYQKND